MAANVVFARSWRAVSIATTKDVRAMRFWRFSIGEIRFRPSTLNTVLGILIAALAVGWWIDHRRLQDRAEAELKTANAAYRRIEERAASEEKRLYADMDRLRATFGGIQNDNLRLMQALSEESQRYDKIEAKRGFIKLSPSGDMPVKFELNQTR
jgi:hypothetical protein